MRTNTWRAALAVPAALLLATGGALVAAGPANAAPTGFTVLNPDSGTALGVMQGSGDQILFQGSGLPAGDTIGVTYLDLAGVSHVAVPLPTGSQDPGYWGQLEHLADLSAGQTHVVATVTALKNGVPDPATTPQTDSFTIGAAFTVAGPLDGATVPTTTPTFSGTAPILGRVRIGYVGADGKSHTAGAVDTGQSTTWRIFTSFTSLARGATTADVNLEYLSTENSHVVNVPDYHETIHFATAPVPVVPPGITTTPEYPTLAEAATTGIAVAAGGFTPGESLTVSVTGPGGTPAHFSEGIARPAADATGSFTDTVGIDPADGRGGRFTITVTGATSKATFTKALDLVADATVTSPANHGTVGPSFTISGKGTPGASVLLIIAPTKEFTADVGGISPDAARRMSSTTRAAAPAAAGSTSPAALGPVPVDSGAIIVGSDGTWHAAFTSVPGDFTFQAYEGLVVNGLVQNLTDPSVPVEFTVAATTTSATGGTGGQLAFTGSQDSTPAAIAAGILMLVGTALTVVARRRRSVEG